MPRESVRWTTASRGSSACLEHGGVLHGVTQYDEVLRIPLVFAGPGIPAGVRVREPVSLVDVLPTALSVLDHPAPDGLDGRDVSPLWKRESGTDLADRFLFGEADWRRGAAEDDVTRSVRLGAHKLIYDRRTGERRLYDLARDPAERVDTSADHAEILARMSAALEEFMSSAKVLGARPQFSPEEVERLQELGYL